MPTYLHALRNAFVGLVAATLIGAVIVAPAEAAPRPTIAGGAITVAIPVAAATPTITGLPAVGKTLTALPGTWASGTTFKYQWYRGTTKISGATKSTRKLTSADKGHAIKVKVTGSLSGYSAVSKTSAATAKIAAHALKTATPTITGILVVGSRLTAVPGTWTSGTSFKYQWYRSGSALSGATSSTLTLVRADDASAITVKVTGTKTSYATQSVVSAATSGIVGPPTLGTDDALNAGQDLHSPDMQFWLVMQSDGNLVEYKASGAIWSTGTTGANHVVMQSDGNLVIYRASGAAVWASGSSGYGPASLSLQNDGNLVVYKNGGAVWAKNVVGWIGVTNGATAGGASGTQSMSAATLNSTQYKVYSPGTRLPIVCGVTNGQAVDGAATPGTTKDSTWHRTLWGDWVPDADFVTGTNGLFSGEPDCNGGSGGSNSHQTNIAAFVQKYNGANSVTSTIPSAPFPGECTSFMTRYVQEVYGYTIAHFGNGVTWAGGSDSAGLGSHGFTWHAGSGGLQDGDLIVWGQGAHYASNLGHVGIWYQGKVFSQNSWYNNAGHNNTGNGNFVGYVGFDNDPNHYSQNGLLGYWRHS